MDLTHTFTVPASVEDTWAAFVDIESVAGCFPGATVTSVEGDEFKGTCKVKLGPISLTYTGTGKFLERDDAAHRFVIEAKGKDKRGNGTAGATVTAALTSASADTTDVEVRTDLTITGKPAQFGRGVIQDVSDKLLQQFATCLESKVGGPGADEGADEGADADAGTGAARPSGEEVPVGEPPASSGTQIADSATSSTTAPARKAPASTYSGVSAGADGGDAPAATDGALDLGATVLPILLKSYWKPITAVVVVLFLLKKLLGRRG